MKNVLKAANFKGFAVSETPRKALRRETCGAPRGGKQSGLSAGKLPAGGGFSFQALFAFLFFPAGKRRLLFSAGMIFCFAGCARARGSMFCFMLWGGLAAGRAAARPPAVWRGGCAPLSRRSQPPPPAACGFSSSGGSAASSFPENLCFANLFRKPCFVLFSALFLPLFCGACCLTAAPRVRSAKGCGASVAA